MVNWYESPEYAKAEKDMERAAWLTVCWVQAGNMAEAQKAAAQATAAQKELTRLQGEA